MSDHDAAPDPMDKAYAQAEAVLSEDSERAARRERVLAAVAREPATAPAVSSPPIRRSAWRRGGWLVAASVAGLSVLLTTQVYRPAPIRQQPAPTTPAVSAAAAPEPVVSPPPAAEAPAQAPKPAPPAIAVAPRGARPSLGDLSAAAPPPAPPPPIAQAPVTLPAEAPGLSEVVVTAHRRESDAAPTLAERRAEPGDKSAEAKASARGTLKPMRQPDFVASPPPLLSPALRSSAGSPPDQAARLRDAAAAGRTAELAALLAKGVPVDASDADGETALMKSIQADHPAAAALLRRHGASLDRKNRAGDSARDMATEFGDAELDQALGLDR